MNKKERKMIFEKASLIGYQNIIKAIRNCDKETQQEIAEQYEKVISDNP